MLLKEIKYATDKHISATHESIPEEELWEDGEVDDEEVAWEMFRRVCEEGDWLLIRRIDG